MSRRSEIMDAVVEADSLHRDYDSRARVSGGEGRIDVFGMLVNRNIPVMFRPLKNLLGAYIDDPAQGVMVTTERPLPVQRFTAAHELGHAALSHKTSLDDEDILGRAPFSARNSYDAREIQANAFATELLTPPWLIAEHLKRQGWKRDNLTGAVVVYQLSLRMGSSYSATCYALAECKAINGPTCDALLMHQPRSIKQSIVKTFKPQNWYRDVWLITERDDGMMLEGSRSDIVVVTMNEHASSGYIWQLGELVDAGLLIRQDTRADQNHEHIGGVVVRTVIAEAQNGARGRVSIREVRPWQPLGEPLNSMEFDLALSGPMPAGLLHAQLARLLEAA